MTLELWKGHNGAKEGEPSKGRKVAPRRKKRASAKARTHTLVDPLQRNTVKPTSAGDLVPDPITGYYTVESDLLASEVKARYPWMLVTEHEKMLGDPERAPAFRVNGLREKELDEEEMRRDGWVKDGTRWIKRQ